MSSTITQISAKNIQNPNYCEHYTINIIFYLIIVDFMIERIPKKIVVEIKDPLYLNTLTTVYYYYLLTIFDNIASCKQILQHL